MNRIEDIRKGNSFIKVFPDNIGEYLYVDSTNTNAEPPKTKEQYRNSRIKIFLIMVATIGALYYISTIIELQGWIGGIAFFIGFFTVVGGIALMVAETFTGKDYFLGTDGYAIYEFMGDRQNIIDKKGTTFAGYDGILHFEEHNYVNHSYKHTNLMLTLVRGGKENPPVHHLNVYYDRDKVDKGMDYDFAKIVETYLSSVFRQRILEEFSSKGVAKFSVYSSNHKCYEYDITLFKDGSLKIGGQHISLTDVEEIYIHQGIMNVCHKAGKDNKSETISLSLGSVCNNAVFQELLDKYYKIGKK